MPGREAVHRGSRPLDRLIIVARGDVGLYRSLQRAFGDNRRIAVIRDRRFGERRQRPGTFTVERRQGDRRTRRDVDAQIRARGWSMVRLTDAACSTASRRAGGAP